jgi:hypothetical protein
MFYSRNVDKTRLLVQTIKLAVFKHFEIVQSEFKFTIISSNGAVINKVCEDLRKLDFHVSIEVNVHLDSTTGKPKQTAYTNIKVNMSPPPPQLIE